MTKHTEHFYKYWLLTKLRPTLGGPLTVINGFKYR